MHISDIHFCPRCGNSITMAVKYGRERPVCAACGWTYFDDPKVAAGILVVQDDQVLLVQRANEPYLGLWSLPAGFVDADEDPARAAERECYEETGLSVQVTGIIDIRWGREHERGADFIIFYRGQVTGGMIQAGDDARAAEWFPKSNLPPLAFKSTQFVLHNFST